MNKIIIIGDSLSFDRPDELAHEERWPQLLRGGLSEVLIENKSRGASTTQRLAGESLNGLQPGDAIIVQLGIVDCAPRLLSKIESKIIGRLPSFLRKGLISLTKKNRIQNSKRAYVNPVSFERNLVQFLDRTKGFNVFYIKILPAGSKFLSSNPDVFKSISQYNNIVDSLKMSFSNVNLIELDKVNIDDYTLTDGYHLNAAGHQLIYQCLMTEIRSLKV